MFLCLSFFLSPSLSLSLSLCLPLSLSAAPLSHFGVRQMARCQQHGWSDTCLCEVDDSRDVREDEEVELDIVRHIFFSAEREREFFLNLLVRIRLIVGMISVDRPCTMGFWIPFPR